LREKYHVPSLRRFFFKGVSMASIFVRSLLGFGVAVGVAGTAFAVPVAGSIAYTGFGGSSVAPGTALQRTALLFNGSNWSGIDFAAGSGNSMGASGIGSFAGDTSATFSDVSFATPGGLLFTSLSSGITFNWTAVTTGYSGGVYGANFEGYFNGDPSNKGAVAFSTQGAGKSWSAEVPVPGSLVLLGLGLVLVSTGVVGRKRSF
jgi:hypothetical protein